MTPEEKILKVLDRIDRERRINHDERYMVYEFNQRIVGAGILNDDEEKRIINKLFCEEIIDLYDHEWVPGYLETPKEILEEALSNPNKKFGSIGLEIKDKFNRKLFLYRFLHGQMNIWLVTNPFWLAWNLLKLIYELLRKIWKWFSKHKIIGSLVTVILSFLAIDFALAWKNVQLIGRFIKWLFL